MKYLAIFVLCYLCVTGKTIMQNIPYISNHTKIYSYLQFQLYHKTAIQRTRTEAGFLAANVIPVTSCVQVIGVLKNEHA